MRLDANNLGGVNRKLIRELTDYSRKVCVMFSQCFHIIGVVIGPTIAGLGGIEHNWFVIDLVWFLQNGEVLAFLTVKNNHSILCVVNYINEGVFIR